MKVHTGKGDDGSTGLLFGGRTSKASSEVEAYGTVDEAVAALGLARAEAPEDVAELLLTFERELFVVGAELATAPENRAKLEAGKSLVSAEMAARLKDLIDTYQDRLPELREFVMPGGNRLSAALDYARTVVRRAERACVGLAEAGGLDSPELLRYMNRLGDLVFLLAREAGPDAETL